MCKLCTQAILQQIREMQFALLQNVEQLTRRHATGLFIINSIRNVGMQSISSQHITLEL